MVIDPIIDIIDLEIGYTKTAKSNLFYPPINISVTKGDFIALVGRNGVGKSTFLRSISRHQPSLSGDVKISEVPFMSIERSELAKMVSYIPAEPIHAANMTVFEFVSLARYPYNGWFGAIGRYDKELIHSALESVSMTSFRNREIDYLSDGERQRAMIAFAVAQDCDIVLMDEPTAFIDLPSKFEIVHLLKELTLKGKTVIFSTHDLHTAIREVDTIWLMLNDGFKVGSPEDLALNNSLNRLFDRTDIYLDLKSGDFLSRKESNRSINLISENEIYYTWTKHALERLGFSIVIGEDCSIPIVECIEQDNCWAWILTSNGKTIKFDSISNLCSYLKINR